MALRQTLEDICCDHAAALFRFLARLTGNEAETRDVLQEMFIRLAKSPQSLDGVSAPRSYLFRMAHRLVIDRYRREEARQRHETLAQREQPASLEPEPLDGDLKWLQRTLAASLDTLPPEQKAVVALKVWEEMTFAEIAGVLDISANTAASRYRYALDKLREALRPLHRDLP